jgi:hypothetical protein
MPTRQGVVSETIEGQGYRGRFTVDKGGVLTVSYNGRTLRHPLSLPDDPFPIAKELLRRLINEVHRGQRRASGCHTSTLSVTVTGRSDMSFGDGDSRKSRYRVCPAPKNSCKPIRRHWLGLRASWRSVPAELSPAP